MRPKAWLSSCVVPLFKANAQTRAFLSKEYSGLSVGRSFTPSSLSGSVSRCPAFRLAWEQGDETDLGSAFTGRETTQSNQNDDTLQSAARKNEAQGAGGRVGPAH